MGENVYSVIAGTGSYIPENVLPNSHFQGWTFYGPDGKPLEKPTSQVIEEFGDTTGILERRHAGKGQTLVDLASLAAQDALESSEIDPASLDSIIVAHDTTGAIPSIASSVRERLKIQNKSMEVYDITAGCPGWLKGAILADRHIRSGANRVLVIGAELISPNLDPHDRDYLIFGDGASALILKRVKSEEPVGILSHSYVAKADTLEGAFWTAHSYNPDYKPDSLFLKMNGHEVFEYVLRHVPQVVKESIDKAGLDISEISKVFVHQANGKMIERMLKRLFRLYEKKEIPDGVLPMTVSYLGNTSVASIPTLLDLTLKGKLDGHKLQSGNYIVLVSVGAGINIDSVIYRII